MILTIHKSKLSKSKSMLLPSPFLGNRVAPISISFAFGLHSDASTVNATVRAGYLVGSPVCFTPMLFPEVQNAK